MIIFIRDFGPGIPEEELPHVKEKFYKGSSKARGSGIGLAVCDEIVHLHGGTLTSPTPRAAALVTIRFRRNIKRTKHVAIKDTEENCEKIKTTTIGGQALIEGIMMRGPEKDAIVIRAPDGAGPR